jgi:hypothetical protein
VAYSRLDLISRALRELKALAAGQTPSPEDSKTIQESLSGVQEYLEAAGVGTIDFENVDPADFLALAHVVAFANAGPFQLAGQELSDLAALSERGEKRLRRVREGDFAYAPVRADYF